MAAHLCLHEPLVQVLSGGQVFRMASRGTRAAQAQAQRQEAHCAGHGEPTMQVCMPPGRDFCAIFWCRSRATRLGQARTRVRCFTALISMLSASQIIVLVRFLCTLLIDTGPLGLQGAYDETVGVVGEKTRFINKGNDAICEFILDKWTFESAVRPVVASRNPPRPSGRTIMNLSALDGSNTHL